MTKRLPFTLICAFLLPVLAAAQIRCTVPPARPLPLCADTFRVHIIGDVMMHSRQLEYDCSSFLEDLKDDMGGADLSVANMEFTLAGEPYSGYPSFSAPDSYPEYVAGLGADVFLLANNHILDKGPSGLDRTLERYEMLRDSLGTHFTGIGGAPLLVHRKGYSIAFINFTYGTNARRDRRVNYLDSTAVESAFRNARELGADFIVALPHWGDEYELRHNRSQENWARKFVELGADAVVGCHPHVVQDTTHIGGVPVIYSVGNAVSNMSAPNTRLELAVTLTFVCENGVKRQLEPELEFLWCTLPGTLTPGYATIKIKKWASRKDDWLIERDYFEMVTTLERVLGATGINY